MDVLKEKYGTVVANDGLSLAKELGVTHIWHIGNFRFGARLWGIEVDIAAEPMDDGARELKILSVRLDDKALRDSGAWSRKVGFCYHMKKGQTVAESYCELPVSVLRYVELMIDAETEGTAAHKDVWSALETLTKLQSYDSLIGFKLELPKETDGEDDDE